MPKHIGEHIKAVIFDHDDTLVDTIEPKWGQHKHVAKTFYGLDLSDEELKEHWGAPLPTLVKLLYKTDDVETAMRHVNSTLNDFPKVIFPKTIDMLRMVHGAGKRTGIVTATSRFSFENDLSTLHFPLESIDYTQTADDTEYHKPDPRVFEPTLAWLATQHILPKEVLYIGDGLRDHQAAEGAGFHFLGVETGLTTSKEFAAAGIISIAAIKNLLED